ncbi:MAG: DUF2975 domain-containing protein [Bacilli bacterium]|nr:DUF2975 domain-containing protein [Bacilli bacterium]
MDNKKLSNLGRTMEVLLKVGFVLSIVIIAGLYFITKLFKIHFDLFIIMIYPCGLLFTYMIYEFICLFKSLYKGNPFCLENVKILKNNMFISIIIGILVLISLLISCFMYNYYSLQLKFALGFISLLFFVASIAFYILSELFNQAHKYKEENDLTI